MSQSILSTNMWMCDFTTFCSCSMPPPHFFFFFTIFILLFYYFKIAIFGFGTLNDELDLWFLRIKYSAVEIGFHIYLVFVTVGDWALLATDVVYHPGVHGQAMFIDHHVLKTDLAQSSTTSCGQGQVDGTSRYMLQMTNVYITNVTSTLGLPAHWSAVLYISRWIQI